MGKKLSYYVKVKLRNGQIREGFVPPPFWVEDGQTKTLYTPHEPGKLGLIQKDHWSELAPAFKNDTVTFLGLPTGYLQFTAEEIGGVEVLE